MQKNYQSLFYLFFLVCLFSCKRLKINYVTRHVFPELFPLKITPQLFKGNVANSYYNSINKNVGGEVANFVKVYTYRFEYIVAHALDTSLSRKIAEDATTIKTKFQEYLLSENFYKQFTLLINPSKTNPRANLIFSKEEYFHTGSLFFICDEVNKKDTSINYHICVGINGIPDHDKTNEKLALQALCFEAIFKNIIGSKSLLLKSFDSYISKAATKYRRSFVDYNSYLQNVRHTCFKDIEYDKNFQKILMTYYLENRESINFTIK